MTIGIGTLIVRGGEYAKSQALKFESVKDYIGLENMTVTYILDPEAYEGLAENPDGESSSDWEEGSEEDWDSDDDDDDDDE